MIPFSTGHTIGETPEGTDDGNGHGCVSVRERNTRHHQRHLLLCKQVCPSIVNFYFRSERSTATLTNWLTDRGEWLMAIFLMTSDDTRWECKEGGINWQWLVNNGQIPLWVQFEEIWHDWKCWEASRGWPENEWETDLLTWVGCNWKTFWKISREISEFEGKNIGPKIN